MTILEHQALHESLSSSENVQPMFAAQVVLFRNCFKGTFLAMKLCEVLSIREFDKAVSSEWSAPGEWILPSRLLAR